MILSPTVRIAVLLLGLSLPLQGLTVAGMFSCEQMTSDERAQMLASVPPGTGCCCATCSGTGPGSTQLGASGCSLCGASALIANGCVVPPVQHSACVGATASLTASHTSKPLLPPPDRSA